MTKKKALVNESVIRRWGKLANMPALTENFLDTVSEEEELEEADEEEMEMKMDDDAAEAPAEERDAVEKIVNAVVDAISQETGVDIEVEGDAGGDEMDMDADDDAAMRGGMDDPAMRGADNMAMRDEDPANRADEVEEGMRGKPAMRGDKDKAAMRGDKEEKAMRDDDDDKAMRHDKKVKKEELELEVIDDEELTEAVLKRVVERLLRRQ